MVTATTPLVWHGGRIEPARTAVAPCARHAVPGIGASLVPPGLVA